MALFDQENKAIRVFYYEVYNSYHIKSLDFLANTVMWNISPRKAKKTELDE